MTTQEPQTAYKPFSDIRGMTELHQELIEAMRRNWAVWRDDRVIAYRKAAQALLDQLQREEVPGWERWQQALGNEEAEIPTWEGYPPFALAKSWD